MTIYLKIISVVTILSNLCVTPCSVEKTEIEQYKTKQELENSIDTSIIKVSEIGHLKLSNVESGHKIVSYWELTISSRSINFKQLKLTPKTEEITTIENRIVGYTLE